MFLCQRIYVKHHPNALYMKRNTKYKATDILLIEDTPADAELFSWIIRKDNPFLDISIASDGQEALDLFFDEGGNFQGSETELPKLVLLDLKLPKISGLEVLEKMKHNEATRNLPIVVLTSSEEDKDIEESYSRGANSYVVKPIGCEEYRKMLAVLNKFWLVENRTPRISH